MANYYLTGDATTTTPTGLLKLSSDAPSGNYTLTAPNSSTQAFTWITENAFPGNAAWNSTGTISIDLNVTTASSALSAQAVFYRVSSTGTVLSTLGTSSSVSLGTTGVKNLSASWNAAQTSGAACDNRIRVIVTITSTNAHGGAVSAVIALGANSKVNSPVTEFTGVCLPPPTQFSTDFSTSTIGSAPVDFTRRSGLNASATTIDLGSGAKAFRYTDTTSDWEEAFSYDAVTGAMGFNNAEILVKTRSGVNTGYRSTLHLRLSGSNSTHTAIQIALYNQSIEVGSYVNATWAAIQTAAFSYSADQWVWIRFRVNGTSVQARAWLDGNTEPGTWAINSTTSNVASGTYHSIGGYHLGSYNDFAYVSVATNGGTAASPAPTVVAPTVTTSAATSVGQNGATGNGNVTSDGGGTITERGFVWATTANPTTSNSKVVVTGTTGSYTGALTSLTAGTLYNYRAYAINSAGTSYGANTTFTTTSATAAPSVTSSPVTDIALTSVTANGNVTSDNGAAITERGIVWGTAANPTVSNNKIPVAGTTGAYSTSISGLSVNTSYNYRAYAINSVGTTYGSNIPFTTANYTPPTLGSATLTANKAIYINVSASISALGTDNSTARGFVYMAGTSGDPTLSNSVVTENGSFGTGSYSATISGLTGNSNYRVRPYATNSGGTSYGTTIQVLTKRAVSTIEDLDNIRTANVVNSVIRGDFVITRDLDFNDSASYANSANMSNYTTGNGFIPLGRISPSPWFGANLDGDGHTISNLMVNDSTTGQSNSGLIGVADECTVENLGLINPRINANATTSSFVQCGALIMGIDPVGTVLVKNCFVRGGRVVGGIGTGNNGTGGLCGIVHEYSSGKTDFVNCYTEDVEVQRNGGGGGGKPGVGGFIGALTYISGGVNSWINFTDCYAASPVTADASADMGGFLGLKESNADSTALRTFWDTQVSGQSTSVIGVGKTTAEMKTLSTYTGWSIANYASLTNEIWYIDAGVDYPRLWYEDFSTPPPAGTVGYIKVWNGSSWVLKPAKVWNGSAWVTKPVKRWNGTAWESVDSPA